MINTQENKPKKHIHIQQEYKHKFRIQPIMIMFFGMFSLPKEYQKYLLA
ncbi:hypothetical protein UUU_23440 [Klebsiella pneumoniae subsp. pneumoniae DSM 30104 = JCM 1662 = NBRC 14940]|nr:hypothetical protein UUU_23440 [Klebsiella pneumoniae subsp. pneumoniae DSM 30104 = JCM 1662 = NBRC 14940]